MQRGKKSNFSNCISLYLQSGGGGAEKSLPVGYKHSTYAGGDYEGCGETFDPNPLF